MNTFRTMIRTPALYTAIAATLALAACAAPRTVPQLDAAREAVAAAHADAGVTGAATTDLSAADAALAAGVKALDEGGPLSEVEHHAYLADRYATAAREHGRLLASQTAVDDLARRRTDVLLAARNDETRRATAEAAVQNAAAVDARTAAGESARQAGDANARAADLQRQLGELQARQTDRGDVVTLGDVLFSTGRSELQEGARRSLDRLSAFLVAHPERHVRVEGFTDANGSEAYNLRLSEQRADAVAHALARGGVARSQIDTRGYGIAYPVAGNDSAAGRQLNRRVEVVISRDDARVAERSR